MQVVVPHTMKEDGAGGGTRLFRNSAADLPPIPSLHFRRADFAPATRAAQFNERQISSAVSTVLRLQEFPFADAAGAEQCGYGDLR
jgi:hypothetical protein